MAAEPCVQWGTPGYVHPWVQECSFESLPGRFSLEGIGS